jgi:hypothetical protein
MKTWREVPLVVGHTYRIESDIPNQHAGLLKGQTVEFVSADYSHYDNLTALTFRDCATDRLVQLWWFDSDPEFSWGKLLSS